jgi:lysophospholipase L1-like esterase
MRLASTLLSLVLLLLAGPAMADDFALKDGDRVVFYGDSITDQRLYTTFVEAFVTTRFPKTHVTFVHSGWGGDRVTGGGGGPIDTRLHRDVLAYKPTVVTIMLGMNDASYRPFDNAIFDTYCKGYEHIVDTLKSEAPDVRLTLIQPSPFDDVTRKPNFEGGYNNVLLKYGDYVKELAAKKVAMVADLNTTLTEATKKAEAVNHDQAVQFNPDRVHPAPAGQLLMAAGLLKAWHAPDVVSAVELDVRAPASAKARNAQLSDVSAGPPVSWTQVDEALPFPLDLDDKVTALALQSSDFVESLDRQMIRVTNLPASEYTLKIDGQDVGSYTREQLAEGVNLATVKTPMWSQARQVLELIRAHNDAHFTRWRFLPESTFGAYQPAYKEAQVAIDRLEAEVVKKLQSAASPRPHRFELVPKG